MFECVLNLSEGQRLDLLDEFSDAAGSSLRDRHSDPVHNRSVFTLINDSDVLLRDVRSLITLTMRVLDLEGHAGVHPRIGVVDVVPFVALDPLERDQARTLRDECAQWIAATFSVPVFLYGELSNATRTLPEIRRGAFRTLSPDFGPEEPHRQLGACAVGARDVLVAWNICLRGASLASAKEIAMSVRGPAVRSLAFEVGDVVQVSCNLVDPYNVGPESVYDRVEQLLTSGVIERCELVGLIPEKVVRAQNPARWAQLGLSLEATIEARLAQ